MGDVGVVMHFTQIRFYKQATLRTAAFTQSIFQVHMLLHIEVCAQRNFYTQTPVHTEPFTQRGFTHRSALFSRTCTVAV